MHGSLRIAVPIHSLEPGGVERVALGLASEWDRAGHRVTIVLGRSGCANLCSAPALDYWQIPTRLPTASWETPWMVHSLYSFLIENRVDVLFCPGNTYAVVAAAVKLLLGDCAPPMILKVSNALNRPDMPPLMRRGYDSWLRLHGTVFDRLVALSEPMHREIRERTLALPEQLATIANPLLPRKRLNLLSRIERRHTKVWSTRYLTAGRLVPQKNFPLLLRAFARAARPDDTLTIAGEGPEHDALVLLATELGIAGRVRFTGYLASIDPLLAEADAFVLSSDYEGLPGVIVEALAAGLPVLATDCCVSMSYLLDNGRTGVLVPARCEESLARGLVAIRQFRTDPARARQIASGFELEGAARRYIELMNDVVRQNERNRQRKLTMSCLSSQTHGPRLS
ncbi:Glycosyltransferase involved in cell wall bisynthesis [Novosphingobium mathurense]|uniref:Glycosyltransferase involved in cell wall bisynthesis n=1 Tax=Novosphingobium mathurense TaxID=428990 RepID=A0A1U6HZD5_9SPHN|nr:glycosyltransferase [Novosphingobium sp. KN65.2]CDO37932.1 putative Glycosyl transferase, group 1 [Novosphingobium sp. KN65.2]SLK01183.1 Glycosyltransferase involved in cell wall bisynthesis [Novosphingobium mathurense]